MKKNFLIFTILFTLVCFSVAGFFARMAGNEAMTAYWTGVAKDVTKQVDRHAVSIAIDEKEIKELKIKLTSEDLKIEESPDDELHIKMSLRYDVDVVSAQEILKKISDGVFAIDFDNIKIADKDVHVQFTNVFNFNVTVDEAKVLLQIPKNVRKIKVQSVSGNMTIALDSDEVMAEAVSGSIKIAGKISELKAKTISGDGKIFLSAADAQLKFSSVSGNVKVIVPAKPNFVLDFETVSGELGLDKELSDTHFQGSFKGFQLGQGSAKIGIKTVSGDARISRETATE